MENVMTEMFGIFNQKAEDIKISKEVESGSSDFYKIDPNKVDDKIYRAVVRLVPNIYNPNEHVVHQTTYWLKDENGKGFSYLSPKTKGKYEKCVVADQYWAWRNSKDARLEAISKQIEYNRSSYVLIQVVKDMVNPENDGKIFKLKLPVKIQKMIDAKLHPSEEDIKMGESSVQVFDPMSAPLITLKVGMKKADGSEFRDWDQCSWNDKSLAIIDPETKRPFEKDGKKLEGKELQEAIIKTLIAAPNLKDYAYVEPSAEVLARVTRALKVLEGAPINADAPADSKPAETKAEAKPAETKAAEPAKTEAKVETKAAETPAETKSESAPKDSDDDFLKGIL